MITSCPEVLAAKAQQLITDGQFVEARETVLAYCRLVAKAEALDENEASLQNASEFLHWAIKSVAAMRSHALLRRSELNRSSAYAGSDRRGLKTWEIVS